jgi:hypothetical protein
VGFAGFKTIRHLQANRCRGVPLKAGVYFVMRDPAHICDLSATSCGGRFKGKNPRVPIARLRKHWVDGASVLYIGKAGGGGAKGATLQQRLWAYMRFGNGDPASHSGGRFIWQLTNCLDLVICWKPSGKKDALKLEKDLIREFIAAYSKRPFANLRK